MASEENKRWPLTTSHQPPTTNFCLQPMNAPHQPRQIGQILIAKGILSEDQLRIALLEQMKSNRPIGKLLVSLGFVSEATLRDALSESLGKQSVDLSNAIIDPSALKLVSRELILHLLKRSGVKIATKQVARFVPFAGQAVAAAIGYAVFRQIGNQHVNACAAVAQELLTVRPE